MVYNEELAERVRCELATRTGFEERKMFGGLAFMVNTHMACGIVGDDLMVRVGKDNYESALAKGAREMDFTGRPMRGMVMVDNDSLRLPDRLEIWVRDAVDFALSEPARQPKRR